MSQIKLIGISSVCRSFNQYSPRSTTYSGSVHLGTIESKLGLGFHKISAEWRDSYLRKNHHIDAIGSYWVDDILLFSNGHAMAWFKSGVIKDPLLNPVFTLKSPDFLAIDFDCAPELIITDPCIVIAGWAIDWYGHFITDFVPRILSMYFFDKTSLFELPIFIPHNSPAYVEEFFNILDPHGQFNIKKIPKSYCIKFKTAYIPTYMNQSDFYHPSISCCIESFLNNYRLRSNPSIKIYVSRMHRKFIQKSNRVPLNEESVIAIVAKRGYRVCAMEDMSFNDKFSILSQSKTIVGFWGSGLHNSLFAQYGTVVGSIGAGSNNLQSGIGALRCQPTSYLDTYINKNEHTVDLNVLDQWLDYLDIYQGD